MRDFKARNKCDITGAWLMLHLQDEQGTPKPVMVIQSFGVIMLTL